MTRSHQSFVQWIHDLIVRVFIVPERTTKERVGAVPTNAQRAGRHILADVDHLRCPTNRVNRTRSLEQVRQHANRFEISEA